MNDIEREGNIRVVLHDSVELRKEIWTHAQTLTIIIFCAGHKLDSDINHSFADRYVDLNHTSQPTGDHVRQEMGPHLLHSALKTNPRLTERVVLKEAKHISEGDQTYNFGTVIADVVKSLPSKNTCLQVCRFDPSMYL